MKQSSQKGSALIITMLLFVTVSIIVVSALLNPVMSTHATARTVVRSKQSFFAAHSGVSDVLYRLKNGMTVSSVEILNLGSTTATTTITDINGENKQVRSVGEDASVQRNILAVVNQGEGTSFSYGVQAGRGGFILSGSSGINGSVYANGNIIGTGSTFITGSAFAANTTGLTAAYAFDTGVPSMAITVGNSNGTQDFAQRFTVPEAIPFHKIQLYIRKQGNPANATVRIVTDVQGQPSATFLATGTLSASQVTGSYGWVDVVFTTNPTLLTDTPYWLVIDTTTSASHYYIVGGTQGTGVMQGRFGTTWTPASMHSFVRIFTGGLTATISGDSQWNRLRVGTSGTGSAHAYTIQNTTAPNGLYCQIGSGNASSCITSQPPPAPQPWPVSDGAIDSWKEEAVAGGTIGSFSVGGSSTQTLGPRKIEGNLTVNQSGTLIVSGTLWVTGNLTIGGSGRVRLANGYGNMSGSIIVDGTVSIGGSSPVSGSGTPGSYLVIVSLSDCPTSSSCGSTPAIAVSGSAGAVVLVAQRGTIDFSGSASARQATGYTVRLSGSSTLTYESGLADIRFTSGPSGSWNVESWQEVQ